MDALFNGMEQGAASRDDPLEVLPLVLKRHPEADVCGLGIPDSDMAEMMDTAHPVVNLGLEPIHPRDAPTKGCVNSIAQAIDLIEQMKATGLILDLFHSWWDADLVAAAARPYVRAVQICNVTAEPRRSPDLGHGILDVAAIVRDVRASGYVGPIEFEIFAADHGQDDVLQLLRRAADWSLPSET